MWKYLVTQGWKQTLDSQFHGKIHRDQIHMAVMNCLHLLKIMPWKSQFFKLKVVDVTKSLMHDILFDCRTVKRDASLKYYESDLLWTIKYAQIMTLKSVVFDNFASNAVIIYSSQSYKYYSTHIIFRFIHFTAASQQ